MSRGCRKESGASKMKITIPPAVAATVTITV